MPADRAQPRHPRAVVARQAAVTAHAACIVPAGEGRTIFALPWYGRTLIGTTDNDYAGDIATSSQRRRHRIPPRRGQHLFRHRARHGGPDRRIRRRAPLISTGDPRKSVDISRKAELYETSSGMLTITGGKLTTWRRWPSRWSTGVARARGPGRPAPAPTTSRSGWRRPSTSSTRPRDSEEALPDGYRELLAFRYGHAAHNVLRLAGEHPELAKPIVEGHPHPAGRGRGRGPGRAGADGSRTCSPAPPGSGWSRSLPPRSSRLPSGSAASSAGLTA